MRLSVALKLAAILAAALTVGLVAAVKSMDMKRARVLLADQVRAVTGRELVIAGPLELRLGAVPRIIATGITLSNAPGGSRSEMVKIERAEAELSLLPLFKREIRINRLIVSSPDILLESDRSGRANWSFTPPAQPAAVDLKGMPTTRLTLREVKIKNSRVVWRDGTASHTVNVHKLTVLPDQTAGGPLAVRIIGDVDSKMFEVAGRVGDPMAITPAKPWPLQIKGTFDGTVLVAEGGIADPLARRGIDIKLNTQGEELGNLARFAGFERAGAALPLGPFKLSGHLSDAAGRLAMDDLDVAVGKRDSLLVNARGTVKDVLALAGADLGVAVESDNLAGLSRLAGADVPSMGPLKLSGSLTGGGGVWKLSDLKATLAGSDATGELALDLTGRPRLAGKLNAGTLSVADFATPAAKPGEKLAPKHFKTTGDGRLFAADPLPVDLLKWGDGELALHATRLEAGKIHLGDTSATISLRNGRLALKPVSALLGGGQVEGEAVLDGAAKPASLSVRLTARQVGLGNIAKDSGSTLVTGAPADGKMDLRASGQSVRALLASTTGEVVMSVGEGPLDNTVMDWPGGDILMQLMGAANPLAKSEEATHLNCAVARFVVKDGLATAQRGLAVETAKVQVTGAGTVDLRTEALDLGISPRARDGVGLSLSGPLAGITRLRGTLADPKLGVDEIGAVRTAASAGAAMATGGLSLLGELAVDKFTADPAPCQTALGRAPAKKGPKKQGIGAFEGLFGR